MGKTSINGASNFGWKCESDGCDTHKLVSGNLQDVIRQLHRQTGFVAGQQCINTSITNMNAKKCAVMQKSQKLVYRNVEKVICSDDSSFTRFSKSWQVRVKLSPREQFRLERLSSTARGSTGSGLDLEWRVTANKYKINLSISPLSDDGTFTSWWEWDMGQTLAGVVLKKSAPHRPQKNGSKGLGLKISSFTPQKLFWEPGTFAAFTLQE